MAAANGQLDMHTHLLFGVDDGALDIRQCKEMLLRARKVGISRIVATPHLEKNTDLDAVYGAFEQALPMAEDLGLRLYPGFEIGFSVLAKLTEEQLPSFCMAGTRCFLMELPRQVLPPGIEGWICEWIRKGFHPILAHPERYAYIQKNIRLAYDLRSFGCELQVDAGGLVHSTWYKPEGQTARKLMKAGAVDYIASDAHCPEGYDLWTKLRSAYAGRWPEQGLLDEYLT